MMISPGWRGTGLDWTGLDWVVLDCSFVVTRLSLSLSFNYPLLLTLLARPSSPPEKSAAFNILGQHGMFEMRYPLCGVERQDGGSALSRFG